MTNLELIIKYVKRYGSITPAKMCGRTLWGKMFGSETPRECRLLRQKGLFASERKDKFTAFYFA